MNLFEFAEQALATKIFYRVLDCTSSNMLSLRGSTFSETL